MHKVLYKGIIKITKPFSVNQKFLIINTICGEGKPLSIHCELPGTSVADFNEKLAKSKFDCLYICWPRMGYIVGFTTDEGEVAMMIDAMIEAKAFKEMRIFMSKIFDTETGQNVESFFHYGSEWKLWVKNNNGDGDNNSNDIYQFEEN